MPEPVVAILEEAAGAVGCRCLPSGGVWGGVCLNDALADLVCGWVEAPGPCKQNIPAP